MPAIPTEGGGRLIKGEKGTLIDAPSLTASDVISGPQYEQEQPVTQMGGLGASAPMADLSGAAALAGAMEDSPDSSPVPINQDTGSEPLFLDGQSYVLTPKAVSMPGRRGPEELGVMEGTWTPPALRAGIEEQAELQAQAVLRDAAVLSERDRMLTEASARAANIAAAATMEQQAVAEQSFVEAQAEVTGLRSDMAALRDRQIDPDHFWSSRGSGARVLGAIAMALGAVAQSVDPRLGNPAARIIEGAIDRDIRAQEVNLESDARAIQLRSSLLAQNMDVYKDRGAALVATRAMQLEQAALETEGITSQYASQGRIYQGARLAAELRQKAQIKLAEFESVSTRLKITANRLNPFPVVRRHLDATADAAYGGNAAALQAAQQSGIVSDVAEGRALAPPGTLPTDMPAQQPPAAPPRARRQPDMVISPEEAYGGAPAGAPPTAPTQQLDPNQRTFTTQRGEPVERDLRMYNVRPTNPQENDRIARAQQLTAPRLAGGYTVQWTHVPSEYVQNRVESVMEKVSRVHRTLDRIDDRIERRGLIGRAVDSLGGETQVLKTDLMNVYQTLYQMGAIQAHEQRLLEGMLPDFDIGFKGVNIEGVVESMRDSIEDHVGSLSDAYPVTITRNADRSENVQNTAPDLSTPDAPTSDPGLEFYRPRR